MEEDYIKDIKFYDDETNQIKSLINIYGGKIHEKIMSMNQLDFTDSDNQIQEVIERMAKKIHHHVVSDPQNTSQRNIENEWVKWDSNCKKALK